MFFAWLVQFFAWRTAHQQALDLQAEVYELKWELSERSHPVNRRRYA